MIETEPSGTNPSDIDFLHEIGSRMAAADPFHTVLSRIVSFVSSLVQCDSCFIYVLNQDNELVLRASKNPHPDVLDRLKLRVGQGITGWVAEHREPVAVARHAFEDSRFRVFNELPEDRYEAFLSVPVLSRGKLVAVINLQHGQPHEHSRREIQLISTIGFLVGAEIEMARLEVENSQLSERLEARKVIDRAKGILQRELGITEEEAYLTIQRQSRQRRKTKKDIAEALIIGDELRRGKCTT
jgi:uroporphyrinogen-III synthase